MNDENWPAIYSVSSPRQIGLMGGNLITIEGKNFGSILSSFGEEGRDENADIEIYFLRDGIEGQETVPCEEVAHFHNPTQLFCYIRQPFPFSDYYIARVKINGHQARLLC